MTKYFPDIPDQDDPYRITEHGAAGGTDLSPWNDCLESRDGGTVTYDNINPGKGTQPSVSAQFIYTAVLKVNLYKLGT